MTLAATAFWVLGASSRDNRARLLELADDLSEGDEVNRRSSARTELTSPRLRLRAELRWLPGVSPSRAVGLVKQTLQGPVATHAVQGLQPLPAVNVLVSGLVSTANLDLEELDRQVLDIAELAEQVTPESVFARINEDRSVAGISQLASPQVVATELDAWRADTTSELAAVLRTLTFDTRIATLTSAIEDGTAFGGEHGPSMLHDLADLLAVDARDPMTERAARVLSECAVVRRMGEFRLTDPEVIAQVEWLEKELASWDAVAQPFQLSAQARGREHDASRELGFAVRSVAIDLYNEAGLSGAAERITKLVKEVFAELNLVAAKVDDDLAALASLKEAAEKRGAEQRAWEAAIRYEGTYGLIAKERVGVSAAGVRFNKRLIALSDVKTVRWGATNHSLNGIPTGTTYSIFVAGSRDTLQIDCRAEDVFKGMVNSLHRAVLWRLAVELVTSLRAGQQVTFGSAVVVDTGVWLIKKRIFARDEQQLFSWDRIALLSENGAFVFRVATDAGFSASMPYLSTDNVHVLESVVRRLWKQGGDTLSGVILDDDSE